LKIFDRLIESLKKYSKGDSDLLDWRFDLHESKGIEVGLKDNRLGGPYSAPAYKRSTSGELYLIWKDNRYTSTKLDLKSIEEFDEYIKTWKATAYKDPDGAGLYTPKQIPQVLLNDSQAQAIVGKETEKPFQLLNQGLNRLLTLGLRKVDGKLKCYQDLRTIANSHGLLKRYIQTPVEFFFEVNDSYGQSYQEKKWPDQTEIDRIIEQTGRIGILLEKKAPNIRSGPLKLLFPPDIFESFLGYFLINNLYGNLVVNRQSRFSVEDFRNHSQVIREDLQLKINNLLPWRAFSYPCTNEGVPGGEMTLISAGKLQSPILNVKYGKKLSLPPTPLPIGGRGFFLETGPQTLPWNDLINTVDRGLIVLSVLGLHTQDSSSGSFSLTVDQGLVVEDGQIIGKTKAVINGDFLKSLISKDSQFGRVENKDNPGYLMVADASI
jgi:PmbA protein